MHLAEFNFGTLRHPWGDPRISGFEIALDQVNAIGARSPGFVWRLIDDDMDFAQEDPNGALADRPNTAFTLSVWEGAAPLYNFVTKTLHVRSCPARPIGSCRVIADILYIGSFPKPIGQQSQKGWRTGMICNKPARRKMCLGPSG